jgi:predicted nucleic acid-binding protein
LLAVDEDRLFVSVVSFGEIRQGAAGLPEGRRRRELEAWLSDELPMRFDGRILDVTRPIAEVWGELSADAKRRGKALHVQDAYLAATAIVHRLTIVTRNIKDFRDCGPTLVNPWDC